MFFNNKKYLKVLKYLYLLPPELNGRCILFSEARDFERGCVRVPILLSKRFSFVLDVAT